MEMGLYTFADQRPERSAGKAIITHQRIKDLLEEIQLADQLGLDVFGVGEHHRADYDVLQEFGVSPNLTMEVNEKLLFGAYIDGKVAFYSRRTSKKVCRSYAD